MIDKSVRNTVELQYNSSNVAVLQTFDLLQEGVRNHHHHYHCYHVSLFFVWFRRGWGQSTTIFTLVMIIGIIIVTIIIISIIIVIIIIISIINVIDGKLDICYFSLSAVVLKDRKIGRSRFTTRFDWLFLIALIFAYCRAYDLSCKWYFQQCWFATCHSVIILSAWLLCQYWAGGWKHRDRI